MPCESIVKRLREPNCYADISIPICIQWAVSSFSRQSTKKEAHHFVRMAGAPGVRPLSRSDCPRKFRKFCGRSVDYVASSVVVCVLACRLETISRPVCSLYTGGTCGLNSKADVTTRDKGLPLCLFILSGACKRRIQTWRRRLGFRGVSRRGESTNVRDVGESVETINKPLC